MQNQPCEETEVMTCDSCGRWCLKITVFNAFRKPRCEWIRICSQCLNDPPCTKFNWDNGIAVCKHGRRWELRAFWGIRSAITKWDEFPRSWFLKILAWLGVFCFGKSNGRLGKRDSGRV